MSIDYAELKTELQSDPKAMGYATHVAAGQDQDCANLVNALTGPGAATISLPAVPAATALDALSGPISQLQADIYANFAAALPFRPLHDMLFAALNANGFIDLTNSWLQGQFQNLLTAVSSAGAPYLTQAQLATLTSRTGSRAEVLFGAGTVVGHLDVAKAMGRA